MGLVKGNPFHTTFLGKFPFDLSRPDDAIKSLSELGLSGHIDLGSTVALKFSTDVRLAILIARKK